MEIEALYVAARVFSFIFFFPLCSAVRIPLTCRAALGLGIWFFVAPLILSDSFTGQSLASTLLSVEGLPFVRQPAEPDQLIVLVLLANEIALGLLLALMSGAVFWGVMVFGRWLSGLLLPESNAFDAGHLPGGPLTAGESENAFADSHWSRSCRFAISLLTAAVICATHATDVVVFPLIKSFTSQPIVEMHLADFGRATNSLITMVLAVFQLAGIIALPFFVIGILIDIFQLLLQRLCGSLFSKEVPGLFRAMALVFALSLGTVYVEHASVEFAQRWTSEQPKLP